MHKFKLGFSLVELMVIIAVLAIIISIAVPSFTDTLRNNQVRTQANELVGLLNYARSEAIKRRTDVEIEFDTAESNWSAKVVVGTDTLRELSGANTTVTTSVAKAIFDLRGRRKIGSTECVQLDHNKTSGFTRNISIGIGGSFQVEVGDCS